MRAEEADGADSDALVKKSADAQAAQRYDEAVQAFAEANQLAPDDAATKGLLTKALKARDDVKTAADKLAAQEGGRGTGREGRPARRRRSQGPGDAGL